MTMTHGVPDPNHLARPHGAAGVRDAGLQPTPCRMVPQLAARRRRPAGVFELLEVSDGDFVYRTRFQPAGIR